MNGMWAVSECQSLLSQQLDIITGCFAGEHQDHQRQPRRGGRPPQRPGVGKTTKRENSKQQQQQQQQQSQSQSSPLQLPPPGHAWSRGGPG